jgi:hypothetical protein
MYSGWEELKADLGEESILQKMEITPIRGRSSSNILSPDDSTPSPPSTPELFQAQYASARQQLDFEETPAVMQSIPLPGPPNFQGIPPPPTMIQIPLGSLNTLANIPGGLPTVQGFRPIESINMQENISPTRYRNYPPPMQEQVDQKMNEEEERKQAKWEDKMKILRRMR